MIFQAVIFQIATRSAERKSKRDTFWPDRWSFEESFDWRKGWCV